MEVNLQIPGIENYNKDVLFLVIPTMTYSETVLVMFRSKIMDRAMRIITRGELMKVTMTWRQAHFEAVMSGSLQLPHTGSNGTGVEKVIHSSPRSDTGEVKEFFLEHVRGPACTTQKVTIPPFSTISVHGNTSVRGHCMQVHMLAEPMPGPQLPRVVVPTATYRELHPGSLRVPICLCNLDANSIEMSIKTVVSQAMPANQVPPVVLTGTSEESNSNPQKGWVLEALDLQGLRERPKSEQEQARELMLKWEHLFACSNLDLGKTALIKHKIEVTDWMPFKEHYPCIPPHMYNDVRAHIQGMLDIGAI